MIPLGYFQQLKDEVANFKTTSTESQCITQVFQLCYFGKQSCFKEKRSMKFVDIMHLIFQKNIQTKNPTFFLAFPQPIVSKSCHLKSFYQISEQCQ